jgi:hypothetical protein
MPQDATFVGAKELFTKESTIINSTVKKFQGYKLEYFDVPSIYIFLM